ncbi:PRC-barrel domain containing protein [Natrialbaceae archaeon AArc-T1-2]|uniref:PRC-barrel domain containing protein n=1 Tax=Natrialbaceae archaeon AArc-T1-2 TaxID=3053904 RepID=UPI00255B35E5|nr:PRC-barrel domain containing protein [Natrialbaceae archaeon AArc-T1-2]WIV68066.1 PRC-barrel domain containing protein [Natrialbaceae archaeon AArc-T1-2]
MSRTTLTADDEGKRVLNTDGTAVGRIVDVEDGRGYVEPDPSLTDTIKAKLGWGDVSETAHPLDEGSIERITDDEVYLRGNL